MRFLLKSKLPSLFFQRIRFTFSLVSLNIAETVVLLCETKSREFDAKLLLACFIAEKGIKAIVKADAIIT